MSSARELLFRLCWSVAVLRLLCLATREVQSTAQATTMSSRRRHVGLFTNTGPYSHDVMMFDLAKQLAQNGLQVTVIQVRIFDFNITTPSSNKYSTVAFDSRNAGASDLLRRIQTQIWHSTVPFGDGRPNLKSLSLFMRIYDFQVDGCEAALRNSQFLEQLKALHLDLMVVDYLLNECALGISIALHTPRIYLSNYPTVEAYMDYVGVPSNPSYVPTMATKFRAPMGFVNRVLNTISRTVFIIIKRHFNIRSERLYRRLGYQLASFELEEKRNILFATPGEFLLEVSRPMTHHINYFGCTNCMIKRFKIMSQVYKVAPRKGVILASFGTIPNALYLPERIIDVFRSVFADLQEYNVVLQLPQIQKIDTNLTANVIAADWIPLQELLGDPSVKLFITHGGIGSVMEAISKGVPMLGIPLQGDQVYNLGRLVEKGIADVMYIADLSPEKLSRKLGMMLAAVNRSLTVNPCREDEHARRRDRTRIFKDMLATYKQFTGTAGTEERVSSSVFWIRWTMEHFLRGEMVTKFIELKFPTSFLQYFMLQHATLFVLCFGLAVKLFL